MHWIAAALGYPAAALATVRGDCQSRCNCTSSEQSADAQASAKLAATIC